MAIRVAVVDDSSFVRKAIARMLREDEDVEVVGLASSGEELLSRLEEWRPDVITLDLSMPGMGGLATLDRIQAQHPTPVIILSTHSAKDAPLTIEALHRGAMDFIDKQQYSLVDFGSLRRIILEKIHLVTSGSPPPAAEEPPPRPRFRRSAAKPSPSRRRGRYELLVLGASTGGPPTLQTILEDLGGDVNVPVAVVQHMPAGFTRAFAERLNVHLPLHVREARHGERLQAGTVYIAPAGIHFKVEREGPDLLAVLDEEPVDVTHRPSVDELFRSAARAVKGRGIGVVLTGMGSDGAQGLLRMAEAGAQTLVQDETSCIVYGMPRAALNLGAVREVVTLEAMGPRLATLLGLDSPGPDSEAAETEDGGDRVAS